MYKYRVNFGGSVDVTANNPSHAEEEFFKQMDESGIDVVITDVEEIVDN